MIHNRDNSQKVNNAVLVIISAVASIIIKFNLKYIRTIHILRMTYCVDVDGYFQNNLVI